MSSINNINGVSPYLPTNNTPAGNSAAQAAQTAATVTPRQDTYTKSAELDKDRVNELKTELNNNMAAFRQMVEAALDKQGHFAYTSLSELFQNIEVDEATRLQAQEAIAEDGYWGVEQTATRILDMAKALSGGDASKINKLEAAVLKGFEAAEKTWGGKLADISYQTKDRILDGFEEWRSSFKAED